MNKNRAHATHMLAKKSPALYAAIADGEKKQMGVNGMLQEQTRMAAAHKKNPSERAEIAESITTAEANAKTELNNAVASRGVLISHKLPYWIYCSL